MIGTLECSRMCWILLRSSGFPRSASLRIDGVTPSMEKNNCSMAVILASFNGGISSAIFLSNVLKNTASSSPVTRTCRGPMLARNSLIGCIARLHTLAEHVPQDNGSFTSACGTTRLTSPAFRVRLEAFNSAWPLRPTLYSASYAIRSFPLEPRWALLGKHGADDQRGAPGAWRSCCTGSVGRSGAIERARSTRPRALGPGVAVRAAAARGIYKVVYEGCGAKGSAFACTVGVCGGEHPIGPTARSA